MKLRQITSSDKLAQAVVAAMEAEAPILGYAEFYSMIGNADNKRKASAASGGDFRELDADYADNKIAPVYITPTLKILGDKVQVDRAYERRGIDIPSVRARDLLTFAGKLGLQFQNFFVNGDASVTAKQFSGLKKITPAGQKFSLAADGLTVTLGNDNAAKTAQQKFIEGVYKLCGKIGGGPTVLMMDGLVRARLSTIAKELVQTILNDFGKPISFFNGVPIVEGGYDKAGNLVLPHTEAVGASGNVCTSIYAIRFGEATNLSLPTNVGVEVKDMGLVGAHYTHSVDFDADLALENDKAIARLEGIILG